jgi:hypothetical protein
MCECERNRRRADAQSDYERKCDADHFDLVAPKREFRRLGQRSGMTPEPPPLAFAR